MTLAIRRSETRGYFDYEWLKTYHTFSFGEYDDPNQRGFRSLRVLNEDKIMPGTGFPIHSHRNMEIFTIVNKGRLAHQDNMEHNSILAPGQIQIMSAGTGITHTELNASDKEEVKFLQIWVVPNANNLQPSYQEKYISSSDRENKWRLILSIDGRDGSLIIHQDVNVYLADLEKGKKLTCPITSQRYGWLQIIEGSLKINDINLMFGDGLSITNENSVEIEAQDSARLLFLDLA